ncbi:TPA: phosphoglycerate dehydrogenase, partial [Escherichia coli]|nr:phosphoglycerate dehydrogenase [Escherichia coli]
ALRESICAVIAGKDGYQADTLSLLPGVRIISRFGTGIDNIDLRAAQQSGIVVNNAVGINSNAVAEFIIGLIFASMRNIPGSYHAMQNGYWGESHGCELQGKRIGLVGYGNIGKTLAKRLSGFDVELLAFDKQPDYQFADKAGVQFVSIEDIFMQSHVIIVLLPFSSELENFISHKYLSMMRNGALIINAARGKLLDEGALLQVIEERNVFAALDVFSSEPLAQFSPLLHAKNIITTPHIAAATVESYQQTGIHVAQSIIDYFAGREIKNVL